MTTTEDYSRIAQEVSLVDPLKRASQPRSATVKKLALALGVIGATAVLLSGCSLRGDSGVDRARENLANQRKVSITFVRDYPSPELETIRFTTEGGRPSAAYSWRANAVVTVNGKDYEEILGTTWSGGDRLPALAPDASVSSVTVIFSDGTSEVLT